MTKIPHISGKSCIKALRKIGYYQKRQEGSHIISNPVVIVIIKCGARQKAKGKRQEGFA